MAAVPELERDLVSAYGAHFPMLYRRARRLLPSDEAEDLVQETYLRAWMRHGDNDPGLPWLLTVLRNLAIDRSRKKHADPVGDASVLDGPGAERTEDVVVALEERRRVRTALARLTDSQREAIRLREWEGLSQREIASALGTTEPAVESLLLRGRRRLRRVLDRAMGLVLWPFAWRRLQGADGAGNAVGAAPAVTNGWMAAVANLATAATVMVAGAAAPTSHDGPPPAYDRAVAPVVVGDSSSPERIRVDGGSAFSDSEGGSEGRLTGSTSEAVTQEPTVGPGTGGQSSVGGSGGTKTDPVDDGRPQAHTDPPATDDDSEVEDPQPEGGSDPPSSGGDDPPLPSTRLEP